MAVINSDFQYVITAHNVRMIKRMRDASFIIRVYFPSVFTYINQGTISKIQWPTDQRTRIEAIVQLERKYDDKNDFDFDLRH